jgi:hypothetical protein
MYEKALFFYVPRVALEAENWTMEGIIEKLPHVKPGGDFSPALCKPRCLYNIFPKYMKVSLKEKHHVISIACFQTPASMLLFFCSCFHKVFVQMCVVT